MLSAIAGGDRQAYAALYYRYSPILFGLLNGILGDRMEAEDVLQEVFLQVWRRAADFDADRGRPFLWLTVLARSRALDRLGTLTSRKRATASGVCGEARESPPDPVEEASLAEEARRLRRALDQIPEEQRRVLLLAYFGGLSQVEIATRLAEPLGTVKSHARLGLVKLRRLLRLKPTQSELEDT